MRTKVVFPNGTSMARGGKKSRFAEETEKRGAQGFEKKSHGCRFGGIAAAACMCRCFKDPASVAEKTAIPTDFGKNKNSQKE